MLVARFLAGECDEEERATIERARQAFPEVRECLALASETLNDVCSSSGCPETGRRTSAIAGVISRKAKRASVGQRIWRLAFSGAVPNWAAAACLLIAIGLGWALMTRLNNLNTQSRRAANQSGGLWQKPSRTATSAEVRSLQSELQELKNQVAELSRRPAFEAPAVIEAPQTPKALDNEERVATAVRGFTGLGPANTLLSFVSSCPRDEITDATWPGTREL